MAKDTRIPVRISAEQKAMFEEAADRDGVKSLSAWLRWLADRRIDEQAGKFPQSAAGLAAETHSNGSQSAAEPAPVAFIPGFGLEEET